MPVSAEEEWKYWDTKATELRRTQLATVQTAATKWSAILTALLGVFGAVAFAGGLTTIDKLPMPFDIVAKTVTTAAAVTAVVAIAFLNRAAGGLKLTKHRGLTATTVREINTAGAKTASDQLNLGKIFAVLTALLVLGGSLLVLWVREKSEVPSPPTLLAIMEGELVCGELSAEAGTLTIGGKSANGTTSLVVVPGCP